MSYTTLQPGDGVIHPTHPSTIVSKPTRRDENGSPIEWAWVSATIDNIAPVISPAEVARITALETSTQQLIENELPQPHGAGNKSRKVYAQINGVYYEAWANPNASSTDIQTPLTDLAAASIFNLQEDQLPRPHDSALAHLYKDFCVVYIKTDTTYKEFRLLAGATLAQRQNNPTDGAADTSKWQLVSEAGA